MFLANLPSDTREETMDPEVKILWVSALRSGEYPQTKDQLQDDNGYCCLGVLCDLAVKAGVIAPPFVEDDGRRIYNYDTPGLYEEDSVLPQQVKEWAKLSEKNPYVRAGGGWTPISEPNDQGASFDDIADLIDQQF